MHLCHHSSTHCKTIGADLHETAAHDEHGVLDGLAQHVPGFLGVECGVDDLRRGNKWA